MRAINCFNVMACLLIAGLVQANDTIKQMKNLPGLMSARSTTTQVASVTTTYINNTVSTTTSNSENRTSTTFSSVTTTMANSTFSTYSESSSITTGSVVIPSSNGNPNILQMKQLNGTVYIAFGSTLGFLVLLLIIVWGALNIRAWSAARKEYQLREREAKYQIDPFFHFTEPKNSDDDDYSFNSSTDSDISEKVLKHKQSRMSIYSFGSNSALNLLSNVEREKEHINNPRLSMFISPTDILKNEGNQWNQSNSSNNSEFSLLSPGANSPVISAAQIIPAPSSLQQHTSIENTSSQSRAESKTKAVRPPSVNLDLLLDEAESQGYKYFSNEYNQTQ